MKKEKRKYISPTASLVILKLKERLVVESAIVRQVDPTDPTNQPKIIDQNTSG